MNKILERSESWVVLEPLKQYLESEGVVSEIRYEWIGNRGSHGDAVLLVEEDVYERARAILDEIDKTDMGDGQPLRDASGRTFAERKALVGIHYCNAYLRTDQIPAVLMIWIK